MPQSPHSIPQEREGSLMAKSLSPSAKTKNGLTVHSWVPPSSKFTGKILIFKSSLFGKNYSKSCRFRTFCPQSPRIMRNSLQNSSTLAQCFQILTIGRELHGIGANRTDFVHFADSSCELREIR